MHCLAIESTNEKVAGYVSFVCLSLTNSTDQNRPRPLKNNDKKTNCDDIKCNVSK